VHVDDAHEHANEHTGKNHDAVQSGAYTTPSFNRDAEESQEKLVEVDDKFAVPARAIFTLFSS
jgi:hypothetical protein